MFKKYQPLRMKNDIIVYYLSEYLNKGTTILLCQIENYGPLVHLHPQEIIEIIEDDNYKFIN